MNNQHCRRRDGSCQGRESNECKNENGSMRMHDGHGNGACHNSRPHDGHGQGEGCRHHNGENHCQCRRNSVEPNSTNTVE